MKKNKRLAELAQMKAEGLISDQEFETLTKIAEEQFQKMGRREELTRMKAQGLISDEEFAALTDLAAKQSEQKTISDEDNGLAPIAGPRLFQTKFLAISAIAIIAAAVFSAFYIWSDDSSSSQESQNTEAKALEIAEERIKLLMNMYGMTRQELIQYASHCKVDLSNVYIPFKDVQEMLFPELTPEQRQKLNEDVILLKEKPRCDYALID